MQKRPGFPPCTGFSPVVPAFLRVETKKHAHDLSTPWRTHCPHSPATAGRRKLGALACRAAQGEWFCCPLHKTFMHHVRLGVVGSGVNFFSASAGSQQQNRQTAAAETRQIHACKTHWRGLGGSKLVYPCVVQRS